VVDGSWVAVVDGSSVVVVDGNSVAVGCFDFILVIILEGGSVRCFVGLVVFIKKDVGIPVTMGVSDGRFVCAENSLGDMDGILEGPEDMNGVLEGANDLLGDMDGALEGPEDMDGVLEGAKDSRVNTSVGSVDLFVSNKESVGNPVTSRLAVFAGIGVVGVEVDTIISGSVVWRLVEFITKVSKNARLSFSAASTKAEAKLLSLIAATNVSFILVAVELTEAIASAHDKLHSILFRTRRSITTFSLLEVSTQ